MSCIPMVGKPPTQGGPKLPRSMPPWTPGKKRRLALMALNDDPWQRAVAAGHPYIQADLLRVLLTDEMAHVRRCAVKNPSISRDLLDLATRDKDEGIAAYARVQLENT